jgi:hypothetical protein
MGRSLMAFDWLETLAICRIGGKREIFHKLFLHAGWTTI